MTIDFGHVLERRARDRQAEELQAEAAAATSRALDAEEDRELAEALRFAENGDQEPEPPAGPSVWKDVEERRLRARLALSRDRRSPIQKMLDESRKDSQQQRELRRKLRGAIWRLEAHHSELQTWRSQGENLSARLIQALGDHQRFQEIQNEMRAHVKRGNDLTQRGEDLRAAHAELHEQLMEG